MSASMQDIPEEITATLALLSEARRRMERQLSDKPGYDAKLQKPLSELANALRALSSEARQWANQTEATMASATPEQKTAVAIAWLVYLPTGARTEAYRTLALAERKTFEKLPLVYGE